MGICDKAVDSIVNGVKTYIDNRFRNAPFDVTRQGTVTAVLGANRYEVQIAGATYTVPCATNQIFGVMDSALVLAVQGDFNRLFIIGKI